MPEKRHQDRYFRPAAVIGAKKLVRLLHQVASVAIWESLEFRIARFVIGEIGAYLANDTRAHLVPLAASHLQARAASRRSPNQTPFAYNAVSLGYYFVDCPDGIGNLFEFAPKAS